LVVQMLSLRHSPLFPVELLAEEMSAPKILHTKQSEDTHMARRDLVALYGRLGLIVAAFAFVAGIVAGPLLQKLWAPALTVTEHQEDPSLHLPAVPASLVSKDQG
jgi:hypothetical protein